MNTELGSAQSRVGLKSAFLISLLVLSVTLLKMEDNNPVPNTTESYYIPGMNAILEYAASAASYAKDTVVNSAKYIGEIDYSSGINTVVEYAASAASYAKDTVVNSVKYIGEINYIPGTCTFVASAATLTGYITSTFGAISNAIGFSSMIPSGSLAAQLMSWSATSGYGASFISTMQSFGALFANATGGSMLVTFGSIAAPVAVGLISYKAFTNFYGGSGDNSGNSSLE